MTSQFSNKDWIRKLGLMRVVSSRKDHRKTSKLRGKKPQDWLYRAEFKMISFIHFHVRLHFRPSGNTRLTISQTSLLCSCCFLPHGHKWMFFPLRNVLSELSPKHSNWGLVKNLCLCICSFFLFFAKLVGEVNTDVKKHVLYWMKEVYVRGWG